MKPLNALTARGLLYSTLEAVHFRETADATISLNPAALLLGLLRLEREGLTALAANYGLSNTSVDEATVTLRRDNGSLLDGDPCPSLFLKDWLAAGCLTDTAIAVLSAACHICNERRSSVLAPNCVWDAMLSVLPQECEGVLARARQRMHNDRRLHPAVQEAVVVHSPEFLSAFKKAASLLEQRWVPFQGCFTKQALQSLEGARVAAATARQTTVTRLQMLYALPSSEHQRLAIAFEAQRRKPDLEKDAVIRVANISLDTLAYLALSRAVKYASAWLAKAVDDDLLLFACVSPTDSYEEAIQEDVTKLRDSLRAAIVSRGNVDRRELVEVYEDDPPIDENELKTLVLG